MSVRDRGEQIRVFQQEVRKCDKCRGQGLLYDVDGRVSYPLFHLNSSCRSGIIFVLEAPNFDDTFDPDKRRLTYDEETDPTGRFVRSLLRSVGLTPSDVLFTNAVLCLPAKKDGKFPVTGKLQQMCLPWMIRLLEDLDPGVVVALGGQALKAVNKIEKHGLNLRDGAGKLHSWFNRQLLPLYHPGRLGRISRSEEDQRRDFMALKGYLEKSGWK